MSVERLTVDVAVVGLGPAGVAAAVSAARAGARVVALDEGLGAGGQIWRHRSGEEGRLPKAARGWIARLEAERARSCEVRVRTSVVDARPGRLSAVSDDRPLEVEAKAVVLGTGARERFLPFPGWTLPGCLGVGGAQALVKSGGEVRGRRAVVAGSGPLLLPVAATLARAGAQVVAVAEQASAARVARFAAGLLASPGKLVEAARYRMAALRAPYRTGTWAREARGAGQVEAVVLTDGSRQETLPCDLLACAFGLVPSLELARLLGCRLAGEGVEVDQNQRTSVPGVLAAGEACGVGGAELALVEGEIAGLVAAGCMEDAAVLVPRRERLRAFARRLEAAFALRPELKTLPEPGTVVCRCEDVPFSRLDGGWAPRQAKLYTRTGMGPCQGRVCGAACSFLFGWPADAVRAPILPVPVGAWMEVDA